jgi:hypothetical protein
LDVRIYPYEDKIKVGAQPAVNDDSGEIVNAVMLRLFKTHGGRYLLEDLNNGERGVCLLFNVPDNKAGWLHRLEGAMAMADCAIEYDVDIANSILNLPFNELIKYLDGLDSTRREAVRILEQVTKGSNPVNIDKGDLAITVSRSNAPYRVKITLKWIDTITMKVSGFDLNDMIRLMKDPLEELTWASVDSIVINGVKKGVSAALWDDITASIKNNIPLSAATALR